MQEHVIFNGKIIKKKDANISIYDKGYYFDFAVYSSVKIINNKAFFLKEHVKRLIDSSIIINLPHNFLEKNIILWTEKLIKKDKLNDCLIRIILIGDAINFDNNLAKLYIYKVSGLTFYPKKFYNKGIKVITYDGQRIFPTAKTKNMLLSFMAYRKAKENNAIDALLIDNKGCIREATTSNFYAIKKNNIYTAKKEKVLYGVTKKIIENAVKNKYKIIEKNIKLKDVLDKKYEEVFLSSTSKNVMPINTINDVFLKNEFKKTKEILKLFKKYCEKGIL